MATDVSKRPKITGDWKVKAIAGIFLFLVGIAGLLGAIPIGWEESVEWITSTMLVFVGLTIMMYGFADIT